MKKNLLVMGIGLITIFFSSCTSRMVVATRPASPFYARPVAPGPNYMWIDGEWYVRGGRYTWRNGYWAKPRATHWVPGHWAPRRGGWYWHRGHWR